MAEVAARETAAREHDILTEELVTKRMADVATLERAAPRQKQQHHDLSHLSPDGLQRRHNAQSLKGFHNMKLGDAGRSKAAPNHPPPPPAYLTLAEVKYWVRDSTFLEICIFCVEY
jgi:hypothetical protein